MQKMNLAKCSEAGTAWAKSLGPGDLQGWQLEIRRHWCAKCDEGKRRCPDCLLKIADALSKRGYKQQAQLENELNCFRAWVNAVLAA
jgi:hypothetical protein